jgi:hypothetical protein
MVYKFQNILMLLLQTTIFKIIISTKSLLYAPPKITAAISSKENEPKRLQPLR